MYYNTLIIRQLGQQNWLFVSDAMHQFTEQRNSTTLDEIWLVEHYPIFTLGKINKQKWPLVPAHIPIVKSDRGGQITYHGPGQQIMYILLDVKRRKIHIQKLIWLLEETVIATLADYNIIAHRNIGAPGVYVGTGKICSLGLRISKGCSFHGLALNVCMELTPFSHINPCGYVGMRMIQISQFKQNITTADVQPYLVQHFAQLSGFTEIRWLNKNL
ncbi:lipoyl(octanoyl) transferase LipB [Pantoea sp. Mhis]|uniref:lipoyl(octanoyl) transferase LipB n=1 Tax=Pantoea sp. Mhis TaxID=2576759 RepID=UPI0013581B35|nr:lipoyl(octanoyl) transferase LipB [Pantoea sp. Mhis]MXP56265.1 lipoyl(octanoyl) transferase LipB [Pantoea sp. Mhis]